MCRNLEVPRQALPPSTLHAARGHIVTGGLERLPISQGIPISFRSTHFSFKEAPALISARRFWVDVCRLSGLRGRTDRIWGSLRRFGDWRIKVSRDIWVQELRERLVLHEMIHVATWGHDNFFEPVRVPRNDGSVYEDDLNEVMAEIAEMGAYGETEEDVSADVWVDQAF